MKNKHNGGFSLVETLVAIAVLGIVVVPTCNSLITSHRINASTDAMLQAQLAVSSAVETMMAEGISDMYFNPDTSKTDDNYGYYSDGNDRFEAVEIVVTPYPDASTPSYYGVTATSTDGKVSVTTHIRATSNVAPPPTETVNNNQGQGGS